VLFDDSQSLDDAVVLGWFATCREGLAQHEETTVQSLSRGVSIQQEIADILDAGATIGDVRQYFKSCRSELELSVLLILTAAAEARVRLDAKTRTQGTGGQLETRLKALYTGATSDWKVALYGQGILEEWKNFINTTTLLSPAEKADLRDAIGSFKNLLDVRHWVAHGRYWTLKRAIAKYTPAKVAEIVTNLFDALSEVTSKAGLSPFR
jgi:hypothetical protein